MKFDSLAATLLQIHNMKIVLLGYMGSGKSTIGKMISKALNFNFLDLDDEISVAVGKPIPAIFEERGELFFRKKETEILKKIFSENSNFVLALGGGTPCYGVNMDIILKETSHVFYLKLAIPFLIKRLSNEKEQRPLIADIADEDMPEFLGKHLFERNQFYAKATHTILVNEKGREQVIDEIQALLP